MSENEALRYIILFRDEWDKNSKTKNAEALDVAIKSLEEIQSYRAIGTVEEMEVLNRIAEETVEYLKEDKELLAKYKRIGTIDEFKALKEKNTTKKIAYQGGHEKCPTCGSFHVFGKHCTECGQKIDLGIGE